MSGLGLEAFLNHNKDAGSRNRFDWKKEGKATVWLSTRAAPAYVCWNHPFLMLDTVKDKDSGEEKVILRYPRFVSPDPEPVNASQYFRQENDRLKIPPRLDPFLLLREYLRHEADHIPLDAVVFEWTNPKDGEVIQWRRGHLARLVDRTKASMFHSLDTKLEYYFVVCNDDDPAAGLAIVNGTKLLGDKMKEAIGREMESNGDQGNPLKNPYAFRWTFDKNASSPMKSYDAFRYNKARLTDAIREAITSPDFPDPSPDCEVRPGDKAKLRAAMEDAARIDLPWDRLFVPGWDDEGGDSFNYGHNAAPPPADRPAEVRTQPATEASTPASAGRPRRKKAAPPPEPERIQCDDCDYMMLPTDTKCAKCGAEYEVDTADTASPAPAQTRSGTQVGNSDKCWSCGGVVEGDTCTACGLNVTDDIPFG